MKGQRGYTIIEVLLFVTISGAMFTIAFFGTRGTQDSVLFRHSIDEVETKIREAINEVDNGYFANAGQYKCRVTGSNPVVSTPSPTEVAGGNSSECVFYGKHIDFLPDNRHMNVNVMVANRAAPSNVIEPTQLQKTFELPGQIVFLGAKQMGGTVFSSFSLYALSHSSTTDTDIRSSLEVDNGGATRLSANKLPSNQLVVMCFGLDNRRGSITIQNNLKVSYNDDVNCGGL